MAGGSQGLRPDPVRDLPSSPRFASGDDSVRPPPPEATHSQADLPFSTNWRLALFLLNLGTAIYGLAHFWSSARPIWTAIAAIPVAVITLFTVLFLGTVARIANNLPPETTSAVAPETRAAPVSSDASPQATVKRGDTLCSTSAPRSR